MRERGRDRNEDGTDLDGFVIDGINAVDAQA